MLLENDGRNAPLCSRRPLICFFEELRLIICQLQMLVYCSCGQTRLSKRKHVVDGREWWMLTRSSWLGFCLPAQARPICRSTAFSILSFIVRHVRCSEPRGQRSPTASVVAG